MHIQRRCFQNFGTIKFLFVVLLANLELPNRFVRGANGVDAMPAEIMCGVFHVSLRTAQRLECIVDFGMAIRNGRLCSSRDRFAVGRRRRR